MINTITKEQLDQMPAWVDKWVKIGLSTEPADFKLAKKTVNACYKMIGSSKPFILEVSSPYATYLGFMYYSYLINFKNLKENLESQVGSQVRSQVESQVESQVRSQVRSQVSSQVWSQVESQVRSQAGPQVRSQVESQVESQVWSQVRSQVRSQVESQVESQVWSQVRSQVRSQVESQVRSQVSSQVGSQVESQVGFQVWSQVESQVSSQVWSQVGDLLYKYRGASLWASWYAYISFIRDVLGFKDESLLNYKHDESLAVSCGWVLMLDDFCAISDRPEFINLNSNKQLHSDNDMAIKYRDGWGFYALNGTVVPEYLVKTSKESLTIAQFKNEKNADIRAEFIRKYGIERMVSLGKELDTVSDDDPELFKQSEYTLVDMGAVYGVNSAPFLKMKNLTTGIYHFEGVSPECKTVKQAIEYRWGGKKISQYEIGGIK